MDTGAALSFCKAESGFGANSWRAFGSPGGFLRLCVNAVAKEGCLKAS